MQRWSLQSLSQFAVQKRDAQALVLEVAARLSRQISFCNDLVAPRLSDDRQLLKDFNHLVYVHKDTHQLCRQVGEQPDLFDRWNKVDQHVVSSTLSQIQSRHATSIERWVSMVVQEPKLHDVVLTVLRGRLGTQLLCDHAVRQLGKQKENGAVTTHCSIQDCIDDAYTEAKFLCDAHWQISPEMQNTSNNDSPREGTCIRPWLVHSLVELFKNAMNATIQEAQRNNLSMPPPIDVLVHKDDRSIIIDIVDHGHGLSNIHPDERDLLLFGLGSSSEGTKWDRIDVQQSYASVRSPLSSLGVGIPVSRMMMEYFGGAITVTNHKSGGVKASIIISQDTNILERLPDKWEQCENYITV